MTKPLLLSEIKKPDMNTVNSKLNGSRTERGGISKAAQEMQDLLRLHKELDKRVVNVMKTDNL